MPKQKLASVSVTAPAERFLTPAELSARWKITPMTLRRWRKDGKLKALHIGRGVRFCLSDVIIYEEAARS